MPEFEGLPREWKAVIALSVAAGTLSAVAFARSQAHYWNLRADYDELKGQNDSIYRGAQQFNELYLQLLQRHHVLGTENYLHVLLLLSQGKHGEAEKALEGYLADGKEELADLNEEAQRNLLASDAVKKNIAAETARQIKKIDDYLSGK